MFILLQKLSNLEDPETEHSEGEDNTEEEPVEEKAMDKDDSDYYIWSTEEGSADSDNDSGKEEWTGESSEETEGDDENTEVSNNDVK